MREHRIRSLRDLIRNVTGLVGILLGVRIIGLFLGFSPSAPGLRPLFALSDVLSAPGRLVAAGPVAIPYSTSALDPAGVVAVASYLVVGGLAFALLSRSGPAEPLPPLPIVTRIAIVPSAIERARPTTEAIPTVRVSGTVRRGRG